MRVAGTLHMMLASRIQVFPFHLPFVFPSNKVRVFDEWAVRARVGSSCMVGDE